MNLTPEAHPRLERLRLASPLYARLLDQHPAYAQWLEEPRNLAAEFRYQALHEEWRAFRQAAGDPAEPNEVAAALRRWRRLMSLRIAYRSVNDLATEKTTVEELTRLAEFCVRECYALAREHWTARAGEPWDSETNAPAQFSVLALGKLGGEELNFSSDIDLIFVYQGEGECRPARHGSLSNPEFFAKLAERMIALLSAATADGFIFRVDARLRPEGAYGPLVPSGTAVENYYARFGQTWERLALLKARPIAGDIGLGAELLEALHPFRYPRHPPLSLLAEIAAMKRRTEQEIVGAAGLERDVKLGRGGIREIEFLAQAFQVLHAGQYPFLQTHATTLALEQLARYGLIPARQARSLIQDYWKLRRIEHRLQMREEAQTHAVPAGGPELDAIARSLEFGSAAAFVGDLARARERVHEIYTELFSDVPTDAENDRWWAFLTGEQVPPSLAPRVQKWFGDDAGALSALRALAQGSQGHPVTRELVARFQHLAPVLDELFPLLGRPAQTLRRLERFADRYGSRRQFFDLYAANPSLFRVLALLFDRSGYIHELLCAHPEILEEVLRPEVLRRRKTPGELEAELSAGPAGDSHPGWLFLYARAEQVRYAVGEMLGLITLPEVERCLTDLADCVVRHALDRAGGAGWTVIALGKYGGGELTFGSDLDVILVAEQAAGTDAVLDRLRTLLSFGGPLLPTYALDLRLRPHGEAGPAVATWAALRDYHRGALSQLWEKQALTRARTVAGPAGPLAALQREVIYARAATPEEDAAIQAMRLRIQRERDVVAPPQRAFKTGAGGLVSLEFLVQRLQLRHGAERPGLRAAGTRAVLREAARMGLIPPQAAETLLANYGFLKRVEFAVRRDAYTAVSVLPALPEDRRPLARWLGFADEAAFWAEHSGRMEETERLIGGLL